MTVTANGTVEVGLNKKAWCTYVNMQCKLFSAGAPYDEVRFMNNSIRKLLCRDTFLNVFQVRSVEIRSCHCQFASVQVLKVTPSIHYWAWNALFVFLHVSYQGLLLFSTLTTPKSRPGILWIINKNWGFGKQCIIACLNHKWLSLAPGLIIYLNLIPKLLLQSCNSDQTSSCISIFSILSQSTN